VTDSENTPAYCNEQLLVAVKSVILPTHGFKNGIDIFHIFVAMAFIFSTTTFSKTTLSLNTFSTTTLSKKKHDTQHLPKLS
jgi:hypothetical protein